MIKFPYIFTFYSYKGGVGRSMALLNTAYTLAERGRHVLILDLDLEAPGLSHFLSSKDEMDGPDTESPGDIIDLLTQVKDLATNRIHPEKAISKIDAIERFRRSAKSSKVKAPRIGPPGRVDVIPAMMEDVQGKSYCQRLAELDLKTTSNDDLQRMGLILARYLQEQLLVVHSPGLDELGCTESVPYDYVLVDSRTGITELGGLCVGLLCDRLVVCTALNDQNVNGTRSFLQEAGIEVNVRGPDDFQPWDEADPKPGEDMTPQTIGPKPTLVVATPVPYGEIEYKRNRIKELESIIGPISAKLSYHPQMALIESVFVRDYPEEYLAAEYRSLADRMMASVSDHHVQLARRSLDAWNERKDPQEAVDVGIRLAGHDFEAGISFLLQLGNRLSAEDENEFIPAIKLYSALAGLEGEIGSTAFNTWGVTLSAQARTKGGAEADRLFEQAYEKYRRSLEIKPDFHEAFNNWGAALSDQAKTKGDAEADRLFEQSYEKYCKSVEIKPDYHRAFFNWGTALSLQTRTKSDAEADRLFEQAYAKYSKSAEIKPDFHDAFLNWGVALSHQARTKSDAEADRLFEQAYEKYRKSVVIKPDNHEAFYNWGATLSDQAKTKSGAEADCLFEQAYQKCGKAVELKPDDHKAFNNWGNAFLEQAKTKSDAEADQFFEQARMKFQDALALNPKSDRVLCNLACLEALRGSPSEAVKYLRLISWPPEKTRQEIEDETDFDSIRQTAQFQDFLKSISN